MKKAKQLSLLPPQAKQFGGSLLLKGKRKSARPLDSSKPIHLVLKANKSTNLFRQKGLLQKILLAQSNKFGIKIYSHSIQKDHWHFCLKIPNRELYHAFIRALTGIIARQLGKGIWSLKPWTRILTWGRGFNSVLKYVVINELEILGLRPYSRLRQIPRQE